MLRQMAVWIVAAALILLGGCREELSQEKAEAVLKGLANELVKMEGASPEKKLEALQQELRQEGVELKTFAAWLDAHPDASETLAGYMTQAFQEDLETRQKSFADQLAELEQEKTKVNATAKERLEEKRKELERIHREQMAELKKDFEKRLKELEDSLQQVTKEGQP